MHISRSALLPRAKPTRSRILKITTWSAKTPRRSTETSQGSFPDIPQTGFSSRNHYSKKLQHNSPSCIVRNLSPRLIHSLATSVY